MKKWTKEEILTLKKAVSDSADNLKLAFQAASQLTGRTPKACENYWYNHLKKDPESYTLMCFTKRVPRQITETPLFGVEAEKQSLWAKILHWFV